MGRLVEQWLPLLSAPIAPAPHSSLARDDAVWPDYTTSMVAWSGIRSAIDSLGLFFRSLALGGLPYDTGHRTLGRSGLTGAAQAVFVLFGDRPRTQNALRCAYDDLEAYERTLRDLRAARWLDATADEDAATRSNWEQRLGRLEERRGRLFTAADGAGLSRNQLRKSPSFREMVDYAPAHVPDSGALRPALRMTLAQLHHRGPRPKLGHPARRHPLLRDAGGLASSCPDFRHRPRLHRRRCHDPHALRARSLPSTRGTAGLTGRRGPQRGPRSGPARPCAYWSPLADQAKETAARRGGRRDITPHSGPRSATRAPDAMTIEPDGIGRPAWQRERAGAGRDRYSSDAGSGRRGAAVPGGGPADRGLVDLVGGRTRRGATARPCGCVCGHRRHELRQALAHVRQMSRSVTGHRGHILRLRDHRVEHQDQNQRSDDAPQTHDPSITRSRHHRHPCPQLDEPGDATWFTPTGQVTLLPAQRASAVSTPPPWPGCGGVSAAFRGFLVLMCRPSIGRPGNPRTAVFLAASTQPPRACIRAGDQNIWSRSS